MCFDCFGRSVEVLIEWRSWLALLARESERADP
jgi:hypothetical protein